MCSLPIFVRSTFPHLSLQDIASIIAILSLALLVKLKLQLGFIKKTLVCSEVLIYYNAFFFQVIFSPLPVHSWLSSALYRGTMLSSILPKGSSGANMHYRKMWLPVQETRYALWLTNRLYYLHHIIQEKNIIQIIFRLYHFQGLSCKLRLNKIPFSTFRNEVFIQKFIFESWNFCIARCVYRGCMHVFLNNIMVLKHIRNTTFRT